MPNVCQSLLIVAVDVGINKSHLEVWNIYLCFLHPMIISHILGTCLKEVALLPLVESVRFTAILHLPLHVCVTALQLVASSTHIPLTYHVYFPSFLEEESLLIIATTL